MWDNAKILINIIKFRISISITNDIPKTPSRDLFPYNDIVQQLHFALYNKKSYCRRYMYVIVRKLICNTIEAKWQSTVKKAWIGVDITTSSYLSNTSSFALLLFSLITVCAPSVHVVWQLKIISTRLLAKLLWKIIANRCANDFFFINCQRCVQCALATKKVRTHLQKIKFHKS